MTRLGVLRGAALPLTLAVALGASAHATPAGGDGNCFPANGSWQSWSTAEDGDVLYFRVHINDIYRVQLTKGSHAYKSPGYFLVNEVRGSGWICSAIDLDLTLASDYGFRKPLIAVSMRKLTPEEAAAIPRNERP